MASRLCRRSSTNTTIRPSTISPSANTNRVESVLRAVMIVEANRLMAAASDARVPFVAAVLPVAALAAVQARQAVGELDALDVLGLLVAELALDPEAQRGAVGDVERPAVHGVGDQGLGMAGIHQREAFVVLARRLLAALGRLPLQIVGAVEDRVLRLGQGTGRLQQQADRHAGPLADGA